MGEERNCRVPLYCTNKCDIAHTIENSICQTLGNEAVGRDSTSLKILEEFREIYEERLRKIDEDTTGDGMELKLKTLTSWINDLGEQNVMLVQTVEQLEQEAADRVALLEERLKKSSHIALEYMSKLEDYDNRMLEVSEEKTQPMLLQIKTSTRLVQAQQTEEILKTRISNLQNDISGLLELIHRARCDGSWNTDGLSFLEVTYEDIFGSHHHHHHQISDRSGTVDHMQSTNNILHQKLRESLGDYHGKEQEIRLLQEQIACQKADIALKDIQIKNFTAKTQEFQGGELKEITHVVEKQAVCDVAVMTNIGPGESEQETVLLKRGNACPKTEMTDRTPVSSVNKRGVCFASPSKEDYEQQIVELEKALKEARNGTETTTKQIAENGGNFLKDELQLVRRIEECRVNTVLAQAATEEVMEEIENLLCNLTTREEKMHEMEILIHSLQNSIMHSQQDINALLKRKPNKEQKTDDGRFSHSCWTTVSHLLESLKIGTQDTVCEKGSKNQTEIPKHENISPKVALKEIIIQLEDFLQQEKEMTEKYLDVHNLEEKLKALHFQIQDIQKKIDEYVHNKETWHHSQIQSEQKIKKLQLELESVQEDLEHCLKNFEPNEDTSSLELE